jgi:hypothetical protein
MARLMGINAPPAAGWNRMRERRAPPDAPFEPKPGIAGNQQPEVLGLVLKLESESVVVGPWFNVEPVLGVGVV